MPSAKDSTRIVTESMAGATSRQATPPTANATATMRALVMRFSNQPTVNIPATTPAPPAAMMRPYDATPSWNRCLNTTTDSTLTIPNSTWSNPADTTPPMAGGVASRRRAPRHRSRGT